MSEKRVIWEMTSCIWSRDQEHDALLSQGWEPFAASGNLIWFRRVKP